MMKGCRLSVCVVLTLFGWATWGRCEDLPVGTAPTNPGAAGFSVAFFAERLGNDGLRPLKLRFNAVGPQFNRQRRLQIQIVPRTQYTTNLDFQFTFDVTLPQGVKSHEETVLVPQFYRWEYCAVNVLEDGQRWGKVASNLTLPPSTQDWGQRASIGIIVPRNQGKATEKNTEPWEVFPDLRSIVTVLGDGPIDEQPGVKRLSSQQARSYAENLNYGFARFRILDEDDLHSSWLAYTQLDLILVPYPVLRRMESQKPEDLAAIKQWLSAGGQIWTYGAPATLEENSWLSLASAAVPNDVDLQQPMSLATKVVNDTTSVQYHPWNGTYYSQSYSRSSSITREDAYDALKAAGHPMVKQVGPKQLLSGLRVLTHGLGRVVLIQNPDPFPGSFQSWQALKSDHLIWEERQSVDYTSGSISLWAWLMASVGGPPIRIFVLLNGLFVTVMGPILYFVLKRKSRLYLLYFLAPTFALMTTAGLFTYAFVSDGFGNRARIRKLVWVDARNTLDESDSAIVAQSRQTYYTVLDSARGLQFVGPSLVLPLQHDGVRENIGHANHNDRRSDYTIRRTADGLHFGGDFLPTRTQVHYLVTETTQARCPVSVKYHSTGVELTNHLDRPLKLVGICDQKGNRWRGENVESGTSVMLSKAKTNLFESLTDRIIQSNASDLPESYRFDQALAERSLLESRFSEFVKFPPQRSFIALTEVEDSVFALRECQREQCHCVIGGLLP